MSKPTSCDGSGAHRNCITTVPHAHCGCGLPMAPDADQCPLCVAEGTVPLEDVDQLVWDQRTYPSFRCNRYRGHPDAYILLAKAIGGRMTPTDYGQLRRR